MTLDHHPAGSSPLNTAQGTLHAYRHACKLTHINSGRSGCFVQDISLSLGSAQEQP